MTAAQRRQLRHLARAAVNTHDYSGLIAFVEAYDARPRVDRVWIPSETVGPIRFPRLRKWLGWSWT